MVNGEIGPNTVHVQGLVEVESRWQVVNVITQGN